jgi:hypothetical protein
MGVLFFPWFLGPTLAAWLVAGLVVVIALPVGHSARRILVDCPKRYWSLLLGPLAWYVVRRQLTDRADAEYHPAYDLRNPILAGASWFTTAMAALAWLWHNFAGEEARLAASGDFTASDAQMLFGSLMLRVAPMALVSVAVVATIGTDLALILMRLARRHHHGSSVAGYH